MIDAPRYNTGDIVIPSIRACNILTQRNMPAHPNMQLKVMDIFYLNNGCKYAIVYDPKAGENTLFVSLPYMWFTLYSQISDGDEDIDIDDYEELDEYGLVQNYDAISEDELQEIVEGYHQLPDDDLLQLEIDTGLHGYDDETAPSYPSYPTET